MDHTVFQNSSLIGLTCTSLFVESPFLFDQVSIFLAKLSVVFSNLCWLNQIYICGLNRMKSNFPMVKCSLWFTSTNFGSLSPQDPDRRGRRGRFPAGLACKGLIDPSGFQFFFQHGTIFFGLNEGFNGKTTHKGLIEKLLV